MVDAIIVQALLDLGLDLSQIERFARGEEVTYCLPTETDPGIAMIDRIGDRLRSGVLEIDDPGGGHRDLTGFRDRSQAVAIALGVSELELFGGAVINERIEQILLRRGFQNVEAAIPDDLGGGKMMILTKVFKVPRSGE